MSFSTEVKKELVRVASKRHCCMLAEIAAIVHSSGIIRLGREITLRLSTENASVACRYTQLIKSRFGFELTVCKHEHNRFRGQHTYRIDLGAQQARALLASIGLIQQVDGQFHMDMDVKPAVYEKHCCKRAWLRGAFLACGTATNPNKQYQLEYMFHRQEIALSIQDVLRFYDLNPKIISRKQFHVVYLKGAECISTLLSVMGAHTALMSFENTRILKQVRNDVNRSVNCETANLDKTLKAAERQIQCIRTLFSYLDIEQIPASLREIAQLRLDYPEASLQELGAMLDPPLGKSGVSHRLKKIERIAQSAPFEKGE